MKLLLHRTPIHIYLDLAIPDSHHRLSLHRASTNRFSYSLDSSKRPPTRGGRVGAILLAHHHLNFRLISLLFKNLNDIVPIGCPLGIGYPVGMGMGINLCPWVLKWVGIEGFGGYGFGHKEVVPTHTLPIAIPNEANNFKPTNDKMAGNTYACYATLYRPAAE